MNYRMQCSCGHAVYRGANSREEALEKFKALMTQEELDRHYSKYHEGQQRPSVAEFTAELDKMVQPADEALHLRLPLVTA